jgi:hypothetical protein
MISLRMSHSFGDPRAVAQPERALLMPQDVVKGRRRLTPRRLMSRGVLSGRYWHSDNDGDHRRSAAVDRQSLRDVDELKRAQNLI